MNVNDVMKAGQKYIKLDMNESVMVRFEDKFEESKGTRKDGSTFVSYNCPCYVRENGETVTKVWSGSSNFFSRCVEEAQKVNMAFGDANFHIKKITTEDGKTGWEIKVMNAPQQAQPTQEALPSDPYNDPSMQGQQNG